MSAQPELQPATYSDKSREAAYLAAVVVHSVVLIVNICFQIQHLPQ